MKERVSSMFYLPLFLSELVKLTTTRLNFHVGNMLEKDSIN